MDKLNIDNNLYSEEVKTYIKAVEKYIIDTQQCLPDEYALPLRLLADNYERYLKCMSSLKDEGIVHKSERNSRLFINPLYRVLKDCESSMTSICKSFGLETFSRSKIKLADTTMSPEHLIASILND